MESDDARAIWIVAGCLAAAGSVIAYRNWHRSSQSLAPYLADSLPNVSEVAEISSDPVGRTIESYGAVNWRTLDPEDLSDGRKHQQVQDHVEDGWRTLAVSLRGKSHAHSGKWREDAFEIAFASGCQIVAVSDGAGSAPLSRVGSEIAAGVAASALRDFLLMQSPPFTDECLADGLGLAVERAYEEVKAEADRRNIPLRDCACTLLLLVHQPGEKGEPGRIGTLQIGDGAIFLEIDGVTEAREAGDHGSAAGETLFLTSRSPDLWRSRAIVDTLMAPLDLCLVTTDGIADDFYPFSRHAGQLMRGIRRSVLEQKIQPWADSLIEIISYERRGSFDDRTLVLIAPVSESINSHGDQVKL